MSGFALGVVALMLLAGLMWRAAWRPLAERATARPAHLEVLRDQLAALDGETAGSAAEQAHLRDARRELQRRVLAESAGHETAIDTTPSPRVLWAVTAAVPLFALAVYAALGNPAGLTAQPAATQAQATAVEPDVTPEAVQAMLSSLAQRLEKPSGDTAADLQGWTMLARSYAAMQRFADAERAYARAIALAPRDAQLLADRADVLAVLQGQRTAGEPERLIAEALRLDPKNLKALALAGSAAFERGDMAGARRYWGEARAAAAPDSEFAAGLDRSLAAAQADGAAAAQAVPADGGAPAQAAPAMPVARITGRVTLAPALAAQAAPGDTVFVFARHAEGPRMPLAIVRRSVADLPFEFTLDDSLAMSPQNRLSGATRVIVGARISRSGNALPQPGDLQGETAPIATRSDGVAVTIDRVQPAVTGPR